MTRPTARVLAMLEILQSGGTRTVADLSMRLDVDERTARRYVSHLIDLGIPVLSVRGRYGGYRLAPGFRLPPLMFSDEEGLAVLLGLLANSGAGATSGTAVESAAAKMRRVLPAGLSRRLDAVLATTEFSRDRHAVRQLHSPEAGIVLVVAEAARDRRPLLIDYRGVNGRGSRRTVHPYGIVAHSGRWYLTAEDPAVGEVRTFRLDRMSNAEMTDGSFEVPSGFEPVEHVLSGLARTPYRFEVSLRILGSVSEIQSRLPAGLAEIVGEPVAEGWHRVRLRAEHLEWVPGLLAGLGLPFAVEGPEELRPLLRSLAARLQDAADSESPGQGVR